MQATLTLPGAEPILFDLPRHTYHALLSLPPEERSQATVDALNAEFGNDGKDETELTEEDLAAIGRGLAAMDAGDVIPGDVVFAQIREQHGWTKSGKSL